MPEFDPLVVRALLYWLNWFLTVSLVIVFGVIAFAAFAAWLKERRGK